MNDEQTILNSLCSSWGITNTEIVDTANRFFNESKRLEKLTEKQEKQILNLTMKSILSTGMEQKFFFIKSDAAAPTFYFSFVPSYAAKLKETGRGVIFIGETFVFGLVGHNNNADMLKALEAECKKMSKKDVKVNSKN
jgi:alanyl-tRNA synthetase